MNPGFNARTKAHREAIAKGFIAVADKFGATVTRRDDGPNPGFCGQSISLQICLNGVGAQVCISDLHGGDYGLISWFNDYEPQKATGTHYTMWRTFNFDSGFETAVGSQSHARPHHKATSGGTWDLLAARLQAGLRKARDGKAFVQEESAQ